MRCFLAIALTAALAACASTGPSPKTDIAALEAALTTADAAALAYVNLPACPGGGSVALTSQPPQKMLCSDPTIVALIGSAALTAYRSVKAAEAVVNSVNPSASGVDNALAAAQAALSGLQSILATLPAKGS